MRVFILYDEEGQVLSVSQVEVIPEGFEHPYHLDDPGHKVVELEPDDEVAKLLHADKSPEQHFALSLHSEYRFDKKTKRLRKASELAAEVEAQRPAVSDSPKPKPKPEPKQGHERGGQK
jgi:hypothetical protein